VTTKQHKPPPKTAYTPTHPLTVLGPYTAHLVNGLLCIHFHHSRTDAVAYASYLLLLKLADKVHVGRLPRQRLDVETMEVPR